MRKICLTAISLVALAASPIARAQQVPTTDEIVKSLKPKVRTRGLAAPSLSTSDAAFISTLKKKARGLTVEERDQLSEIVSSAAMPAVDLEVNFAINSARLEPSAVETLKNLGAALKSSELSQGSFLVAGHTDARGTHEHNQKLSEERAATVKSFLTTNYQISSDRLLAVGYGQDQLKNMSDPLADENRRVKVINLGNN
jgi:outer membrane protein OmpA-like peptidoglycan-associated protein